MSTYGMAMGGVPRRARQGSRAAEGGARWLRSKGLDERAQGARRGARGASGSGRRALGGLGSDRVDAGTTTARRCGNERGRCERETTGGGWGAARRR